MACRIEAGILPSGKDRLPTETTHFTGLTTGPLFFPPGWTRWLYVTKPAKATNLRHAPRHRLRNCQQCRYHESRSGNIFHRPPLSPKFLLEPAGF